MIAVGVALSGLAACGDFDLPPQRGIQSDIDASRTQRGDSLYPDSRMPHNPPVSGRYY